jgi:sugar transferase EpsL
VRATPGSAFYRLYGKPLCDVVVASGLLIICAPLLAVLSGLIWLFLGRPVFFVQSRPGLHGRGFRLIKLRTMTDSRDDDGQLRSDAERLTRFGRFLRALSLDELPELMNVVRGEMSLVGPRPLLMAYLSRYSPEQARRHEVLPGLTGWAQVNGRNALSWEERLALDVWYVDHVSLWLDLRILARTVVEVVRAKGITHVGDATMHEFMGRESPLKACAEKSREIGGARHGA